jgi:hypothetical protein
MEESRQRQSREEETNNGNLARRRRLDLNYREDPYYVVLPSPERKTISGFPRTHPVSGHPGGPACRWPSENLLCSAAQLYNAYAHQIRDICQNLPPPCPTPLSSWSDPRLSSANVTTLFRNLHSMIFSQNGEPKLLVQAHAIRLHVGQTPKL